MMKKIINTFVLSILTTFIVCAQLNALEQMQCHGYLSQNLESCHKIHEKNQTENEDREKKSSQHTCQMPCCHVLLTQVAIDQLFIKNQFLYELHYPFILKVPVMFTVELFRPPIA